MGFISFDYHRVYRRSPSQRIMCSHAHIRAAHISVRPVSKTPQTSVWKLRCLLPLTRKVSVCEIPTVSAKHRLAEGTHDGSLTLNLSPSVGSQPLGSHISEGPIVKAMTKTERVRRASHTISVSKGPAEQPLPGQARRHA